MSTYYLASRNFLIFKGMKLHRGLIIVFAVAGMIPPLLFRLTRWYNGEAVSPWASFASATLISVLTTVVISLSVVQVMIWLQKNYPWKKGVLKRLFLEVTLTTLVATALITLLTLLTHLFRPEPDLQAAILRYMMVGVGLNFFLVALTEGVFFFRSWRESTVQTERYKNESIRAQLESLKKQVNPHFLFNSLNTLSSMIDVDQEQSKAFVDNLSEVYRYLLQHETEEIVSLSAEMDFIQAYTHLLKQRHGDRIRFHFTVPNKELSKGLPPMTLQLLVENAVKHNVASHQKPLQIEIYTKDQLLCVRNNLQSRSSSPPSTGIGLKNIRERYRFLVDRQVEILQSQSHFEVRVPLIVIAYS